MNPDDLQQQFDDLSASISDLSDSTDQNLNDVQATLDDHSTTLDDLNNQAGQLTFPLSPDTADLIKSVFPTGTIQLVSSTATLVDARINPNSTIMLTFCRIPGVHGILSYAAAQGSATINSYAVGDNSLVAYVILN